jgi:hypothetical protein
VHVPRSLAAFALVACSRAPHGEPVKIVDLSPSLDAIRTEFDAHAGEARFLTLLSPT